MRKLTDPLGEKITDPDSQPWFLNLWDNFSALPSVNLVKSVDQLCELKVPRWEGVCIAKDYFSATV